MTRAALLLAALASLPAAPSIAGAQAVATTAELKAYNVTIRRFDPARGVASGHHAGLPAAKIATIAAGQRPADLTEEEQA